MLFVELLFWTPARLSEEVRDVYSWEVRTHQHSLLNVENRLS